MKYNYDRFFKFKINEDVWECYLITKEESKELDGVDQDEEGESFPAMIDPEKKCIFVCEGHVNLSIIGHELVHLYVDYMCITSANLDNTQFEEAMADFFGYNVEKYMKIRNKLYNKFKKLEGSN